MNERRKVKAYFSPERQVSAKRSGAALRFSQRKWLTGQSQSAAVKGK
jgi:hypothetical protein